MRIMFLDDDPIRYKQYRAALDVEIVIDWAQTAGEAIKLLLLHEYDLISLDHDLGGQQMVESGKDTGYEVAQWIAKMENIPTVHLHTLNPVGARNMLALLPEANIIPFTQIIYRLKT